ncbi:BNR-4 repeat-containing protein [Reichenbachiella sp. MALMAid0571]|uniref:BNR-4 repeat-containing protein n=1 Tax=Reichenbachiella sp. MALMAid0571 TaxID=3143939 RepID=UPI0032E035B9
MFREKSIPQVYWISLLLVIAVVVISSLYYIENNGSLSDDLKTGTVSYFADNGFGKPLSTMQHPAGEYYKEVTYLSYQGPHEDPYVCSYNHKTKKWVGPIQAGTSALGHIITPTDPDEIDNHGRPALIVDELGYIHVFFGGHGGHFGLGSNPLGFTGSGKQTHVVSKNPGDISSWEVLDNISPFGTYSQLMKMSNGNIYLFYRHGPHRSDWVYQKSIDNGRTFSDPVSILKHKKQTDNSSVYDAWYAWFQEGPDDTVIAAFNYHPCANPDHSSLRVNSYAMKMNTVDDSWENAMGEKLEIPLTKESADAMVLIFDSDGKGTRLGTTRADSKGNIYSYFRHSSKEPLLLYHRWNGESWQTSKIKESGYKFNDGDFVFEGKDKIQFLLSLRNGSSEEIGWWNSNNNGINWEKGNSFISSSNSKFVMSALIRNAHPDARIIVGEIPNNPVGLYSKLYLFGDAGSIMRN